MQDHTVDGILVRGAHSCGTAASSHGNNGAEPPDPNASAQRRAWSNIMHTIDDILVEFQDNHVPKPLVQALFEQLFNFVNVQLFNQLLLIHECCSLSHGKYAKTGLTQVSGVHGHLGRLLGIVRGSYDHCTAGSVYVGIHFNLG